MDAAAQPQDTLLPSEDPVAKLYGVPMSRLPDGLYIPPDALVVFLRSFEGPLDLLLYLIRRQKFDIMDIPMATLTQQYVAYVELIRAHNLDLAGDYLVMAAYLTSIKSQLLLPVRKTDTGEEAEDPKAELMRRLIEYEKIKRGAQELDELPICGRDFSEVSVRLEEADDERLPEASLSELQSAWARVLKGLALRGNHSVSREELSIREYMSRTLRELQAKPYIEFSALISESRTPREALVFFLAILELAKEELVHITQAAPFAPIWLTASAAPESLF
ncbi:ScpA family protein [Mesosutterella sp. AGMB02718]|uniref:Segregation and condensation protein A n=1 Tax=Mesosutterella faecium TaxID=2925194 RepID=A0ABT7IKQ8_9BURK|nr:ScpA family protein [Mesosutterella sp. AGMB02718]MDL2058949.1 ScpA family protein [Mesosutterella sp. AGMB02718]